MNPTIKIRMLPNGLFRGTCDENPEVLSDSTTPTEAYEEAIRQLAMFRWQESKLEA